MSDSTQAKLKALAKLVDELPFQRPREPAPFRGQRWTEIERQLEGLPADRRALVVGGEAIADAQALLERGAAYVLACVPPSEAEGPDPQVDQQAGLEVRSRSWQELDRELDGSFDLVLCNDLVHRVTEPLRLLQALRSVTVAGGTLVIGSMMIDDPERSEYLRFIPDRHAGDPSWWFVPGRLALRWLLQTAGFVVELELGEREGPHDRFPVVEGYLKATAR